MTERSFSATYDSTTQAVTAAACLLLALVAWLVHVIFIAPLFLLLIGLAYAYSPRGYAISGGAIVIRRLIGNIRVPLSEVGEIRPGTAVDFAGCVRKWGNGGLFGYYGLFNTTKLGNCYWYLTNRSKTVIITTVSRILVLSPDDPEDFIRGAGVTFAGTVPGNGAPAPVGTVGRNFTGVTLGIGVGVVALALATSALVYSPGLPEYTLTSDQLTIHDRFYPVTLYADAVDKGRIRIVDLAHDTDWQPTARTNGFASLNYQAGWFRVAGGQTVRLYRAGGERLALIPPKNAGNVVLYQAMDVDRFVAELKQRWAGR
jgi:hypothetical protein